MTYGNIVPEALKQKVMSLNHDLLTGHMGIYKPITHVKQSFIRYNMAKDRELFAKSCVSFVIEIKILTVRSISCWFALRMSSY